MNPDEVNTIIRNLKEVGVCVELRIRPRLTTITIGETIHTDVHPRKWTDTFQAAFRKWAFEAKYNQIAASHIQKRNDELFHDEYLKLEAWGEDTGARWHIEPRRYGVGYNLCVIQGSSHAHSFIPMIENAVTVAESLRLELGNPATERELDPDEAEAFRVAGIELDRWCEENCVNGTILVSDDTLFGYRVTLMGVFGPDDKPEASFAEYASANLRAADLGNIAEIADKAWQFRKTSSRRKELGMMTESLHG